MRHVSALAVSFLLAVAPAARGQDPLKQDPATLPARIRDAKARGCAALASMELEPCTRTLVALALLRAGNTDQRALARRLLLAWWRDARGGKLARTSRNYELALGCMAFEGLGLAPVDESPPRTVVRYRATPLGADVAKALELTTRGLLLGRMPGAGPRSFAWGYSNGLPAALEGKDKPVKAVPIDDKLCLWDDSNTQFTVLAFHDASRRGVLIPREVSQGIATHFLAAATRRRLPAPVPAGRTDRPAFRPETAAVSTETPSGSTTERATPTTRARAVREGDRVGTICRWPYDDQTVGGAAMTLAGLSSLAVARDLLGRTDTDIETAIEEGLVGIDELAATGWERQRHVETHELPPSTGPGPHPPTKGLTLTTVTYTYTVDGYLLYSLEKALDLLEITTIDGKDWFAPLAEVALAAQSRDGSWVGSSTDVVNTAFLVLFLSRATLDRSRIEGELKPARQATGAGR
jgi:hypothetical protein